MNVFDIIGPVMIGPSSSHTAGAARIGRIAYMLLGQPAKRAEGVWEHPLKVIAYCGRVYNNPHRILLGIPAVSRYQNL